MLIYNKKLSICPVTTHLPLKLVAKKITRKKLKKKLLLLMISIKILGFKPKIAVVGLNPHCESILRFNEDIKIVLPVVKSLKNRINVKVLFQLIRYF